MSYKHSCIVSRRTSILHSHVPPEPGSAVAETRSLELSLSFPHRSDRSDRHSSILLLLLLFSCSGSDAARALRARCVARARARLRPRLRPRCVAQRASSAVRRALLLRSRARFAT